MSAGHKIGMALVVLVIFAASVAFRISLPTPDWPSKISSIPGPFDSPAPGFGLEPFLPIGLVLLIGSFLLWRRDTLSGRLFLWVMQGHFPLNEARFSTLTTTITLALKGTLCFFCVVGLALILATLKRDAENEKSSVRKGLRPLTESPFCSPPPIRPGKDAPGS